ncbi:MAG: hypothetical protein AB8F95_18040 [Bacteroidia bacterium]
MKTAVFYFIISILAIAPFFVSAQDHIAPPKGGNGVPGVVEGSFIIRWAPVPGAIGYEYVLTNNELCFANCPGDTRQEVVTSTEAVEYSLADSTFYFWITRVIFAAGDTSEWTGNPNYFLATTPDRSRPLAVASREGADAQELRFRLDWSALADAESITLELLDMQGKVVATIPDEIRRQGGTQRNTWYRYTLAARLRQGAYILRARLRLREGGERFENFTFWW